MFTIGTLAAKTKVSRATLRYYEEEGLLAQRDRNNGGYRLYDDTTIHQVRFIRQAKDCGFTLTEIRELLRIQNQGTTHQAGEIRERVLRKKMALDQKIQGMKIMSRTLSKLLDLCGEESRPICECPILSAFQGADAALTNDQGSLDRDEIELVPSRSPKKIGRNS